jgi:hypothetical protein
VCAFPGDSTMHDLRAPYPVMLVSDKGKTRVRPPTRYDKVKGDKN